jgi:hypothetical protein
LLTTLAVFAGSFGYASTHLYVTNAPLQPATVAAVATTSTSTTTLTSTVRTTTRAAVTTTKSS